MEREKSNFEQINPELYRKLERIPKYLEPFGYTQQTIQPAENIHNLIANGKLAHQTKNIYGELLVGYLLNVKNALELMHVESTMRNGIVPALHEQVRLAIAIDYANHFPKDLKYPAKADFRFKLPMSTFNNKAMADLLQGSEQKDLATVHQTFLDIAQDEQKGNLLKDSSKTKYPLFEKYFQEKELKKHQRTYRGVLELFGETGTEGDDLAFQDEHFMGIPENTQNCAHCGYIKEYIESGGKTTDTKISQSCQEGQHEWQFVFPDGKWSREGLHYLKNGDRLTIYDKRNSENILWVGTIKNLQRPHYTYTDAGRWVLPNNMNIDVENWGIWFMKQYPAKLVTKEK